VDFGIDGTPHERGHADALPFTLSRRSTATLRLPPEGKELEAIPARAVISPRWCSATCSAAFVLESVIEHFHHSVVCCTSSRSGCRHRNRISWDWLTTPDRDLSADESRRRAAFSETRVRNSVPGRSKWRVTGQPPARRPLWLPACARQSSGADAAVATGCSVPNISYEWPANPPRPVGITARCPQCLALPHDRCDSFLRLSTSVHEARFRRVIKGFC